MKNMTLKTFVKILTGLFLISFLSTSAFSAVEVFSTYDTKIKINDDETIDVTKNIVLQNTHIVGIVPGKIEFKIAKSADKSVSEISVDNIQALDRYGKPIKFEKFETPDHTLIALNIFQPLLPGFQYIINLDYTIGYESSGLLFKNLEIPIKEDTSIDILGGTFEIELPEGKSFTHFNLKNMNETFHDNKITFRIDQNSPTSAKIEYSSIPILVGDLKGSYVFWISVNLILMLILAFEIYRGIQKIKKEEKHHK